MARQQRENDVRRQLETKIFKRFSKTRIGGLAGNDGKTTSLSNFQLSFSNMPWDTDIGFKFQHDVI